MHRFFHGRQLGARRSLPACRLAPFDPALCLPSLRALQLALEMKDEAIEMLRGYEARCR